jgi:hypothetical protein
MGWVEHVAHMGERRGAYMLLVGKPEGKRLHGRTDFASDTVTSLQVYQYIQIH